MDNYQDEAASKRYLDFLDSKNGRLQQEFLLAAISARLPKDPQTCVLDAACGSGWLARALSSYKHIYACDSSRTLIGFAKNNNPGPQYAMADLEKELPYADGTFDLILLNMAGPDLDNLPAAFANLQSKLKPEGQMLVTLPNPYYTYPVAVWKRSVFDLLLLRKPRLRIAGPYRNHKKIKREFSQLNKKSPGLVDSNFYTLAEYLNAAREAGLKLSYTEEIMSGRDSEEFDLKYQMFRYPLLLLLGFEKQNKT